MNYRTALPFVVLACCLLLVGCKKTVAFLVVDAETKKPLPQTLVDHNGIIEFPEPNAGEGYLKDTLALDENGWVEIKKPKKEDTYVFRLAGYQQLTARVLKKGEKAEYLVIGGPKKKQWFELEQLEDEEKPKGKDKVPTFIIPLKSD